MELSLDFDLFPKGSKSSRCSKGGRLVVVVEIEWALVSMSPTKTQDDGNTFV